ncbi:MAG: extracellular solute-binding protein, partial [Angelakisella sp.]
MNMKKAVAFLLSISMLAASFTACGGQTTSSVASAPTPESSSAVASSSSVAASEPVKEGPFFPLKEKIEVSMAGVRDDAGVPFEDCEAFKKLETETNVDIEWLDWPQSTQKEKRNLTFAGGTLPDAFYGSWTLDKPDVVKYGSEGMLLTFDDYLNEKYMPNFTKVLERQKDLRSAISTPDGHVYVLPSMNMEGLSKTNDTLLINTDWLKKVNKPMPTTIDELFDVLMAFKQAGDLNGNGKNDEIPMSFKYQDGNTGLFGFMGFTGLPMCNKNSRMVIKDGAPVFHSATPEYREFLTYMNKLNENGLLDQEV